jgi:predicted RNase H-like nuclease
VNAPSPDARPVLGVDGYARGWVAVALEDGRFATARTFRTFREACGAFPQAVCIAVDIPIGAGPREADAAARRFVGPRWASVFPTPPGDVIQLDDYAEAVRVYPSLSRQSFALFARIREVAESLADHLVEVHPEVSFRAMAGVELEHPKTTWNGQAMRRQCLAREGIVLPDRLDEGGDVPVADVLDAAAAAWSARRHARGEARSFPPGARRGQREVIWY